MPDPATIAIVLAVFVVAGTVKGTVGMGLPVVAVGLLTVTIGLHQAIVLIVVPALIANLWQLAIGGHFTYLMRRLWPFLGCTVLTVWPGTIVLARVDVDWLTGLLGVLLAVYALAGLTGWSFQVPRNREPLAGPAFGLATGLFVGMTGALSIPGVFFMRAIGLDRHQLVQAMGMSFFSSTAVLTLCLGWQQRLPGDLALLSTVSVAPALIGMALGGAIRARVSTKVFERLMLAALLGIGLTLMGQGVR